MFYHNFCNKKEYEYDIEHYVLGRKNWEGFFMNPNMMKQELPLECSLDEGPHSLNGKLYKPLQVKSKKCVTDEL